MALRNLLHDRKSQPAAGYAGAAVAQSAEAALSTTGAERWIAFTVEAQHQDSYRQTQRGRPGPHTHYVRRERQRFHLTWSPRADTIDYDARSDGMFPLLTNCEHLSGVELLAKSSTSRSWKSVMNSSKPCMPWHR